MNYRVMPSAAEDMRQIVRHIRYVQKSPQNAILVSQRLRDAFRKLTRIPQLGHAREDLRDADARVLPVTGLLVIYDPTLKPLTILRVVHGGRDLRRIASRQ